MGTQYFLGRGAPRDYREAARWYERAAEQGDEGSAYIVASLYEKGEGVAQDRVRALYWYSRAAAGGDPAAVYKAREMRDLLSR
jgi:TPR repeat protein